MHGKFDEKTIAVLPQNRQFGIKVTNRVVEEGKCHFQLTKNKCDAVVSDILFRILEFSIIFSEAKLNINSVTIWTS